MLGMLGCWDLRCDEAVLSTMLAHPRLRREHRFLERGSEMVRQGNWAFAVHLPRRLSHDVLMESASAIARRQQRSGLWSRGKADHPSFAILQALSHAGVLVRMRESGQLRYDPVAPFADRQDFCGVMVRGEIMQQPLASDDRLRADLQRQRLRQQRPNGSWGDVVSATALNVGRLLDLGLASEHPALKRAAVWLLGQFRNVRCRHSKAPGPVEMQHMITTETREELALARELLPHRNLAGPCFVAFPILPTALALHVLVRLGLHREASVGRAYDSLLDMEVREGEKAVGQVLPAGWCGFKCRAKLEARLRDRLPRS